MRNFRIYLLLLLTLFQTTNAANPKDGENIKQEFSTNYQIKERIFLDTQKDIFLAGEKIYFTAYCYDYSLEIKTGLSKIAYIEFFDQDNKPLQQIKVLLNNGIGSGYLEIPKKAATDFYYIRSYTNYMKNEGPCVFFQKRLKVINPFYNYLAEGIEKELIPDSVEISIYPESGNLINGLPGRVAIRITGAEGYYSYFNTSLTDQSDSVIIDSIKINQHGFGYFKLQPEINHQYVFNARIGKHSFTAPLPEINQYGLSVSVLQMNDEAMSVEVRNINYDYYPLALVFEKNGIQSIIKNNITANDHEINLSVSKLPEGIGMLHLQNSYGINVVSRVIYVPPKKPNSVQIINSKQFGRREKADVMINSKNESGLLKATYINMCVYYLTDSADNADSNPFYHEQLKGDLRSMLSIKNYDAIEEIVHNKTEINDLLICASDKKNSTNKNYSLKFLPEIYGDIISGHISGKKQDSNSGNKRVYLSFLDSVSYIKVTSTDSSGRFIYSLTQNPPCSELIISIEDSSENYLVDLDPEFYPYFSPVSRSVFIPGTGDKEKIRQAKINLQVEDLFSRKAQVPIDHEIKFDFYGFPTSKYLFRDYVDLPNLDEFVFEIVDGLRVRKRKQSFEFRIVKKDNVVFKEKPLFMFDGIPYFDNLNEIIKIKPETLKSISLVEEKYFYDKYLFMGIVDIKSNNGDCSLINWPESAFGFDYRCVQNFDKYKEVKYTEYDIENKNIPLYNSVLYWNSNINPDKSGETNITFYTGDIKGEYRIKGTCYSETGSIEYFTSYFEVK